MSLPRPPRARRAPLSEVEWAFFLDQDCAEFDGWELYRLTTGHDIGGPMRFPHYDKRNFDYTERRWNAVKDEVLSHWVANFPGTRPSAWWRFSAPEPRRESESEHAYLDRLDLWLPGETELLPDGSNCERSRSGTRAISPDR